MTVVGNTMGALRETVTLKGGGLGQPSWQLLS